MQFITDALLIGTGGGDDEEQGLLTGIAGTFGQNIVKFSVGLCVYFVKDQPRHVQTMLGACFGGQHLVKPSIAVIDDSLGGGGNF